MFERNNSDSIRDKPALDMRRRRRTRPQRPIDISHLDNAARVIALRRIKSQKITLNGGSLGSWVDEERS